jgi:competence protein ComEC
MLKKKYIIIGGVCMVLAGIGFYIARFEMRPPELEAHFFNLNKGRSIFLHSPHGQTILIDGGQNSEVIRELTKILPFYRRHIDTIIATRSDAKNIGGLIDVLSRYEVGKIIEPAIMGTSTARDAFEKVARAKGIPIEKLKKGDAFANDSMQFKTLFPDPAFDFNKSNIPELAFEIEYGETKMVLLGDLSPRIQKTLIPELAKVYLVEFAHGATKSRVSADLLSKLEPDIIVSTKREETLRYSFKETR